MLVIDRGPTSNRINGQPEILEHCPRPLLDSFFKQFRSITDGVHRRKIACYEPENFNRVKRDGDFVMAVHVHRGEGWQTAEYHRLQCVRFEIAEIKPVWPDVMKS